MLQHAHGLSYIEKKPDNQQGNTPLIVLIHGYGSNEEDLMGFETYFPKDAYIISLRAPQALPFGGYCWYEINWDDAENRANILQARASIEKIHHFISEIKKDLAITGSVTLCGFSQGCILGYALSFIYPNWIQNLVGLSGYIEQKMLPSLEDIQPNNTLYFISHGTEDPIIPIEGARASTKILENKQFQFTYHEYMQGHGINEENFTEMVNWVSTHYKK